MGHAPPRSAGELARVAARQQRRRELVASIPPGAIIGTGIGLAWTGVLVAGFVVGNPLVALMQLVTTLVFLALVALHSRRAAYRKTPEGVEVWFRREVAAKRRRGLMVMEYVQELELEYDYRLGLKQRPDPRPMAPAGRFALEGERPNPVKTLKPARGVLQVRPTKPPPKPPDARASARPPDSAERVAALFLRTPGYCDLGYTDHLASIIRYVRRTPQRRQALVALYDDAPVIYETYPRDLCRCGHFEETHTPFERPLMEAAAQPRPDRRKCVRACSCKGYEPVRVIVLDSRGAPSPANPAYPELWLTEFRE